MSTQAPEATTAPEPSAPAPVPTAPAAPAAPAADPTDWKAEAERWKAQARQNEQRSKANHAEVTQRDEVLRLIAEKVGVPFDGKPDPAALTQRLAEQTTLARQRSVELAVYHAASGVADANALLDSREFMGKAGALDPDAADFRAQLHQIVADAATQARYQFAQAPGTGQPPAPTPPAPASGADFSGGLPPTAQWTEADYESWKAAGGNDEILQKAINDGLLSQYLGIGKPKSKHRR